MIPEDESKRISGPDPSSLIMILLPMSQLSESLFPNVNLTIFLALWLFPKAVIGKALGGVEGGEKHTLGLKLVCPLLARIL